VPSLPSAGQVTSDPVGSAGQVVGGAQQTVNGLLGGN
jgi:hypothetical protein